MRNLLAVLLILGLAWLAFDRFGEGSAPSPASAPGTMTAGARAPVSGGEAESATASAGDAAIADAFRQQRSDVPVSGEGVVTRVLADDRDGSPHQRFLLELGNGQIVLVAHNIELAPRIEGLRVGDRVGFAGEYVWNDKGGLVHWTHRDPRGGHPAGWLRHAGRLYQ
jgi:hypothetical protein